MAVVLHRHLYCHSNRSNHHLEVFEWWSLQLEPEINNSHYENQKLMPYSCLRYIPCIRDET